LFGRQIGDGGCEGTQAVETDDPVLIVKGDEDTRHVALLILPSAKTEPIIERGDTAGKGRAVMGLPSGSIALIMRDQPKR